MSQEILRMLNRPEVKERLFSMGLAVMAKSPEEFAATIQREMAKWGKLIKDAGLRE